MTRPFRAVGALALLPLLGCASVPRDSGFADVQAAIRQETQQPVEWNPRVPVAPPDDAAVAPLLEQELTPDLAVRIAFAHNRHVQATLDELAVARGDLIASRTIRNPVADAEIRFPGDPRTPIEFDVFQPIVDLFQLPARRRVGQARFEAARVGVTASILGFATEVRRNYFGLLAARALLARQDDILKAQAAATELARRQHDAGNITDLDLEGEQSRYEEAKLEQARARLAELQARERLLADLGLVRRAELRLPAGFPPLPDAEPTADAVEEEALARRLDLRIAERQVEATRRGLRVEGTAFLEDLEIGIHHEREPDGKATRGPSIAFPIPIFDRGTAARTRARGLLRQSEQRFFALSVAARSEARAAHDRVLEARARVAYLRDVVVPRKERILRLTQIEYNAMLQGAYRLLEARQDLDAARREEIVATRDYWVARGDRESAIRGISGFSVRPESRRPEFEMEGPPAQQDTKGHE